MTPKEALKLVKSGNPVGFQVPLYHQALDIMENLIAKAEKTNEKLKKLVRIIDSQIGMYDGQNKPDISGL